MLTGIFSEAGEPDCSGNSNGGISMKNSIWKKGKILAAALLLASVTAFTACYTGLDNTENAVKREQKYSEEISDAKENDRETEQQLDDIMEAAGDVSLNDEEQKLPEKYNSSSVDVLEGKTDEVVLANVNTEEKTAASDLKFRKKKYLDEHYEKHGVEMGFASAEEYLAAANKVLDNPNVLHKKEKEDDDEVYYLEETNEFVVVSDDGYIRTYFYPSAGIDYYNRQ